MIYQFKCLHCLEEFEINQPITAEHVFRCPECESMCQRVYAKPQWIWKGSAYRPDGSLRPDSDYAPVMGGR